MMETETYKEYTIEIHQDEFPVNPREDDNTGTMVCFHTRYTMGDKDHGFDVDDCDSWDGWIAHVKKKEDAAVMLPIFMYDHSGVTINTTGFTCPWDSGQVGFIFVSKKRAREIFGWRLLTKKRLSSIESYLKNEVGTYDMYLKGDVYGYKVMNPAGEEIEDGSCWGYYGDENEKTGLMDSAKGAIDFDIKENLKTHGEQQKLELA